MAPSRRDFMKGLAAIAASIPVFGQASCGVETAPGSEADGSGVIDGPSGLQRHGDQPEFYVHSWNLEHFTDQVMDGSKRRIVVREEDIIRIEVYTEQPSEMLAWCEKNLLIVELPQINRTCRVKVNTMESTLLDGASDVIMTIDGVVKA